MSAPHTPETGQAKLARIRELNDTFRITGFGGRVVFTRGFCDLSKPVKEKIKDAIRNYDDFTKDNDPYGEHDFGAVTVQGNKCFWKIDYYDLDCRYGSENPADRNQTCRVLTVMLAEEY